MKDLNQIAAARLPQTNTQLRPNSQASLKLFLDEWPAPPKCIDELDSSSSVQIRKWRLQILLAVNPYGIPSLKFGEAFEKMFGKMFDLREFGFDSITDMINKMPDIFAVQEPDETTAILFPDYPNDKILHDARLGHNFAKPIMDGEDSLLRPTTRIQANSAGTDLNDLIMRAWIDRDEEFPPDVVLPGESYEQLLKVSMANIPGTKGLYQATIISAASPDSIFIQFKSSNEEFERVRGLSDEIGEYFKTSNHSIDAYNVPNEFLLPGFPCLSYLGKERNWERCIVLGRSRGDNKVLVESIDFGGAYSVHKIFLYLIPRQFLGIPRQTFQVSLMGLKSTEKDGTWANKVGSRLRCFSFAKYYLDVLLIEPKLRRADNDQTGTRPNQSHTATTEQAAVRASSCSPSEDSDSAPGQNIDKSKSAKPLKSKLKNRFVHEALIVDRNDKEMDIYVDEILVLETYANQDSARADEIAKIKEPLKKVLAQIPRPKNPFE